VLGHVALAVFVLSCSAVGSRLLWIGAQQRLGPAWSCGLGFTFIAAVGQPLTAFSGVYAARVGEVNHGLAAAGTLFVAAGLSSFYAFTLTVFRLRSRRGWALTVAAIVALAFASFARIGALPRGAEREAAAPRGGVI
jgi:hypothetical protein